MKLAEKYQFPKIIISFAILNIRWPLSNQGICLDVKSPRSAKYGLAYKIRNKKVEKRIWKRKKKRGRIFFEKKMVTVEKVEERIRKKLRRKWKKVLAERKF